MFNKKLFELYFWQELSREGLLPKRTLFVLPENEKRNLERELGYPIKGELYALVAQPTEDMEPECLIFRKRFHLTNNWAKPELEPVRNAKREPVWLKINLLPILTGKNAKLQEIAEEVLEFKDQAREWAVAA